MPLWRIRWNYIFYVQLKYANEEPTQYVEAQRLNPLENKEQDRLHHWLLTADWKAYYDPVQEISHQGRCRKEAKDIPSCLWYASEESYFAL